MEWFPIEAGKDIDNDKEPIRFVCRGQNILPESQHKMLQRCMESLGGITRDDTSRGRMVIDLIDPNIFPFDTRSCEKRSSEFEELKKNESRFNRKWNYEDLREDDNRMEFRYQWLPSEVSVRGGRARFTTPIPGIIDPIHLNVLSDTLSYMLPLFEGVLNTTLNNMDFQVITKCQTYQLAPGDDYKGEFHREGLPNQEHILAVGLYYFHFDSCLQGGDIELKAVVNRGCGGTNVDEIKCPTQEGTAVVFKNDLVYHRLAQLSYPKVSSSSGSYTPVGRRSVLAFFFVNPNERLPSTFHYPPTFTGPETLLELLKQYLPVPITAIVQSYTGIFLTKDELQRRQEIITERRRPMRGPESYIRGGHMD